jgi:endo-1,4-beta-xylanase
VEQRVGGIVTTGNHFDAWNKVGWKIGRHNYMVLAIEAQDSHGSATLTVGKAPPASATAATPAMAVTAAALSPNGIRAVAAEPTPA